MRASVRQDLQYVQLQVVRVTSLDGRTWSRHMGHSTALGFGLLERGLGGLGVWGLERVVWSLVLGLEGRLRLRRLVVPGIVMAMDGDVRRKEMGRIGKIGKSLGQGRHGSEARRVSPCFLLPEL